jgi:pSer/pThr/pTyr-binding forkhead associated (FHA) protein
MAKNVLVLKHFESPKVAGTYHRLVCLTGPNKGESYVLTGERIVIGRGEKADIRIVDTKASREHVELTRIEGQWIATDLGSQNGIMVNEKKVVQSRIVESDKLIVGQTVFKFAKVEVNAKPKTPKEVTDEEQAKEEASAPNKKPMIPLVLLIGVLAVVLLGNDTNFLDVNPGSGGKTQETQPNKLYDASSEYVTALKKRQAGEDKAVKEKLNVIYQRGIREFREGNYYRAMTEFTLALYISPGDPYAEYHLRKTREKLDKTIEEYTVRAQRDEGALKYQSAIVSYCSIIRLLYTVPEDTRHVNAEKQIKDLEAKLGMEPSETNCLKKSRTN